VTVFRNALIGAAGASGGGGGGGSTETIITSVTGGFTYAPTVYNIGFEFTVGASDLTVLTARARFTDTVLVSVWESGNDTAIASVAFTSGEAEGTDWAEKAFASSFTLSAGGTYVVGTDKSGSTADIYRNPSAYTLNETDLTVTNTGLYASSGIPDTNTSTDYLHVDLGYTV